MSIWAWVAIVGMALAAGGALIVLGRKSQAADDEKGVVDAAERVASAQADSPTTGDELGQRLRGPGGL